MDALVGDKLFGVNDGLLVLVDEWRVPAPSVVPDFVEFPRENLNLVKCRFEVLRLSTRFGANYTENVTTGTDERHGVAGRSFPACSASLPRAAAGKPVPRRRLAFEPGALLPCFVDLGRAVESVLDAFPDEEEAALEGGFSLSNRGMDRVVDSLEELSDLVNAEKRVGVENERNAISPGVRVRPSKGVSRV